LSCAERCRACADDTGAADRVRFPAKADTGLPQLAKNRLQRHVSETLLAKNETMTANDIFGVRIPESNVAREVTQLIRDTESDLLFYHSNRVYFWGALTGKRKGLMFDPELLYTAAMFHDIGLTRSHRKSQLRFEVDGANSAREFLRGHGISETDIEKVWTAIALHTTPGIPEHMHPEIALVQAGAGMDALGHGYDHFTDEQHEAVIAAYPRRRGNLCSIIMHSHWEPAIR
jgi:HD domain